MVRNSRTLIKWLQRHGWVLHRSESSHHQFRHPARPGTVTITHPRKDIPTGTLKAIYDQAGWDWGSRNTRR
jgi:predicted RNA binding protein YcfA (HicA-like mRNA interferase family)